MSLSLDNYLASVRRFHALAAELAAELQTVKNARDEALKASRELRQELDATDQQMRQAIPFT